MSFSERNYQNLLSQGSYLWSNLPVSWGGGVRGLQDLASQEGQLHLMERDRETSPVVVFSGISSLWMNQAVFCPTKLYDTCETLDRDLKRLQKQMQMRCISDVLSLWVPSSVLSDSKIDAAAHMQAIGSRQNATWDHYFLDLRKAAQAGNGTQLASGARRVEKVTDSLGLARFGRVLVAAGYDASHVGQLTAGVPAHLLAETCSDAAAVCTTEFWMIFPEGAGQQHVSRFPAVSGSPGATPATEAAAAVIAHFHKPSRTMGFYFLATDPYHRRAGFASELLRSLQTRALSCGYDLAVAQVTALGAKLFGALGYSPDGEGTVEFVMDRKTFTPPVCVTGKPSGNVAVRRDETAASFGQLTEGENGGACKKRETNGASHGTSGRSIFWGVVFGLLGAVCYAIFTLATTALAFRGVRWTQGALSRGVFGLLFSVVMVRNGLLVKKPKPQQSDDVESGGEARSSPTQQQQQPSVSSPNAWLIGLSAATAISKIAFIAALQFIDPSTGSAIFSGAPFISGLVGRFFFRDRFTKLDGLFTVISVGGTVLFVFSELAGNKDDTRNTTQVERAIGCALAVFCSLVGGSFFAIARVLRGAATPWQFTAWASFFVVLVAAVAVPVDMIHLGHTAPWRARGTGTEPVDLVAVALLVAVGVSALFSVAANVATAQRVPAGHAGLLATLDLPIIAVCQVVLLGLELDGLAIGGLTVVIFAALAPPLLDLRRLAVQKRDLPGEKEKEKSLRSCGGTGGGDCDQLEGSALSMGEASFRAQICRQNSRGDVGHLVGPLEDQLLQEAAENGEPEGMKHPEAHGQADPSSPRTRAVLELIEAAACTGSEKSSGEDCEMSRSATLLRSAEDPVKDYVELSTFLSQRLPAGQSEGGEESRVVRMLDVCSGTGRWVQALSDNCLTSECPGTWGTGPGVEGISAAGKAEGVRFASAIGSKWLFTGLDLCAHSLRLLKARQQGSMLAGVLEIESLVKCFVQSMLEKDGSEEGEEKERGFPSGNKSGDSPVCRPVAGSEFGSCVERASFDFVTMMHGFYGIPREDMPAIVAAMYASLRPGGQSLMAIALGSREGFYCKVARQLVEVGELDARYTEAEDVAVSLKEQGIEVETHELRHTMVYRKGDQSGVLQFLLEECTSNSYSRGDEKNYFNSRRQTLGALVPLLRTCVQPDGSFAFEQRTLVFTAVRY